MPRPRRNPGAHRPERGPAIEGSRHRRSLHRHRPSGRRKAPRTAWRATWPWRAQPKSVAGGMDGPPGDPLDRVLHGGPHRPERVQGALLFRTLGALEAVMETAGAGGPCTFGQEAMENEASLRLRGTGPLDQAIHRRAFHRPLPAGRKAPLLLIGSGALPVLGRVHIGV